MSGARTVLVTGASSGIGLVTAVELARRGFSVVATMRDVAKQTRLVSESRRAGGTLEVEQLDVTDAGSIEDCARRVTTRHGALHGLVNNAGIGIGGYFEDLSEQEIRATMETNYFGLLAVTRAFLPPMREARRGYVINVTSLNGRVGTPGLSSYVASKFAVEGFTESLRHELRPFGVHAVLVEPGMFKTEIFEANLKLCARHDDQSSPYYRAGKRMMGRVMRDVGWRARDPIEVARTIARVLNSSCPALRYPVGKDAWVAFLLKWALPERLFLRMIGLYDR